MAWHGMNAGKHKHKGYLGTFGFFLDSLEAFGKRRNEFRALWELVGAFGRLGWLVSIIPYVWYVCMYVAYSQKNQGFCWIQLGRSDPYIYNLVQLVALRI